MILKMIFMAIFVIVLSLLNRAPQMMPALEAKLGRELSASSRVVACRFPFPGWRPESELGEGVDRVWIYKPEKVL